MSDEFDSTVRDIYSVQLDSAPNVKVQSIHEGLRPVRLSLSCRDHQGLKLALAKPPLGAILDIQMNKEEAIAIFSGIRDVANSMGWSMPN